MHKEMIFNLKSVSQQWKKKLSSGSHIVLGKYFNFYFYLEKAELIENYSLIYLPLLQISYSQSYWECISNVNFKVKINFS